MPVRIKQNQRISLAQKEAGDKQWYKQQADLLDNEHSNISRGNGDVSEYKRMKVNYDLYNNILDLGDFTYVCEPFGAEAGELPANMVNRDISSGKIKAVLGMEMKRPWTWKVAAVNSEATTRREQAEFDEIKRYVINQIMLPIRQQIEQEVQQQTKGQDLSQDELRTLQQEIEQQTKSRTPDEVRRYMEREYQDPAEVMSHQLLEYLIQKCDLKKKFNDAFKHGLLSSKGIMYVGIHNGEPEAWNVNSIRFNCDKSPDLQTVEDGEWATCEYRMTPSEVIKYFGDELSQTEIDKIYEDYAHYEINVVRDSLFNFDDYEEEQNTIRVLHCTWKSLRKLGFLYYQLPNQEGVQMKIVDESYQLDENNGDLKIDWHWIPEVYETWKIGVDMYKYMRPIPGQFKDLDNLYYCKLPYYGVIYDNMNSEPTSLMDRLKVYQYYYNIVMYRLELLLASDKGKKILMNINMIPDSAGIDVKKWQYFLESTPIIWYDPSEEGAYADVNTVAKSIDLSLASDIQKYIEIAEYLRQQAGKSVGVLEQVEGQIGPNEAVSNTRQSIVQSSHVLEPYFNLHNYLKKNVLQALIETGKIAYANSDKKELTYVLDDMSRRTIKLNVGLLDNTTLGIFVSNSAKAQETKDLIRQLTHAAMQNQKVELSDVISVIRQEGVIEAEETLKAAEKERMEREELAEKRKAEAIAEEAEKAREFEREKMQHEINKIVKKEEEERKTEIQKAALLGMSFNPETDIDNDGVNDFLEIFKSGEDAKIKRSKEKLDRDKFEHQKKVDEEKIKIEKEKLKSKTANNTKT